MTTSTTIESFISLSWPLVYRSNHVGLESSFKCGVCYGVVLTHHGQFTINTKWVNM